MQLRVKLWHVILVLVLIIALIGFAFAAWKQNNSAEIDSLKYDLRQMDKLYKDKQKAADSFIGLAQAEHERAKNAEKELAKRDSVIAELTAQKGILKKKLNNEISYINTLDSTGQFKLLRANIAKLINAK